MQLCSVTDSAREPPVSQTCRSKTTGAVEEEAGTELAALPPDLPGIIVSKAPIIDIANDSTPARSEQPQEETPEQSEQVETPVIVKKSKKKMKKAGSVTASPSSQRKPLQSPNPTAKVIYSSLGL